MQSGREARRVDELEARLADVTGKLVAFEVMFLAFGTHIATQFADPTFVIRQAMADAEESLAKLPDDPAMERERRAALGSFAHVSRSLLAMVAREIAPQGRG